MPGTAFLISVPTTGAVMTYLKKIIGSRIAIAIFAGTHGVISGLVKNCGQRVFNQIGGHHLWVIIVRVHDPASLIGNVPDGPPAHDHRRDARYYI